VHNERIIALNRKNALFAGSDGGGEHGAIIASLNRDLQTQRHRSAALPGRRPDQDRQRPSQQPDRRSSSVGLSSNPRSQGRGLKARLSMNSTVVLDIVDDNTLKSATDGTLTKRVGG
jgi:hypothetical protein